jgi:hypothetical protein
MEHKWMSMKIHIVKGVNQLGGNLAHGSTMHEQRLQWGCGPQCDKPAQDNFEACQHLE